MIKAVLFGALVGLAIIAIAFVLASMACRWAFGKRNGN
jgi:hypothetical protein